MSPGEFLTVFIVKLCFPLFLGDRLISVLNYKDSAKGEGKAKYFLYVYPASQHV